MVSPARRQRGLAELVCTSKTGQSRAGGATLSFATRHHAPVVRPAKEAVMAAGPLRLIPATPGHRALAVRMDDLVFKKGETPDELRQVHELNYRTFVRELGQHA